MITVRSQAVGRHALTCNLSISCRPERAEHSSPRGCSGTARRSGSCTDRSRASTDKPEIAVHSVTDISCLNRCMLVTYVAAGVEGAVFARRQADRGVDVVAIDVPFLERVRRHEARPVVGRGEGAVGEDPRPGLVGDHAVAPQELQVPLPVQVVVQQRIAELVGAHQDIVPFRYYRTTTDDEGNNVQ